MNPCADVHEGFGSEEAVAASSMTAEFEFGSTHVVKPKGNHLATILWLHGLGDQGSSWSQLFENLALPNIKWICPTAPTRPVALVGGFPCTSWYNVVDISENAPDDVEGLDASAAHLANLLSSEPPEVKLGIGGFSIGASIALYSATCQVIGHYANRNAYPIKFQAVVGLSGWLPCASMLKTWMEASQEAQQRAEALPIFLCHGKADEVVAFGLGKSSAEVLASNGFRNVNFMSYDGLGHHTLPEETEEVCKWLTTTLELDS